MSTLDEFQKRITRLEADMVEVKQALEELRDIMEPAAIGPPMPTVVVPTEEAVEEAVEEAHVEVTLAEEGAEEQEIGTEDVGSAGEVLGKEE